jgi:hypothetical protein
MTPPPDVILGQKNPVHILTPYFSTIHFNIILGSAYRQFSLFKSSLCKKKISLKHASWSTMFLLRPTFWNNHGVETVDKIICVTSD